MPVSDSRQNTSKSSCKDVKSCYDSLDKFVDIFPKDKSGLDLRWENTIPKNVKLTVYCQDESQEGFLINMERSELGEEELIAKKWIIHSELEALAGHSIK